MNQCPSQLPSARFFFVWILILIAQPSAGVICITFLLALQWKVNMFVFANFTRNLTVCQHHVLTWGYGGVWQVGSGMQSPVIVKPTFFQPRCRERLHEAPRGVGPDHWARCARGKTVCLCMPLGKRWQEMARDGKTWHVESCWITMYNYV